MTEEAKRCVDALRVRCRERDTCDGCPKDDYCHYHGGESLNDFAAHLIESLSEQLEQVTRERDGLNIMLSQALAMLEARTRERDAAVRDFTEVMKYSENCMFCKYLSGTDDEIDCNKPKIMPCENCWQWRGVR